MNRCRRSRVVVAETARRRPRFPPCAGDASRDEPTPRVTSVSHEEWAESVFVESCVVVPLPFEIARDAFEATLSDGGFVDESRRAVACGVAALVGERSAPRVGTKMRVQVPGRRRFARDVLIELRWEPVGPARRFFPDVDGDLVLSSRSRDDSGMSIVAYYRSWAAAASAGFDAAMTASAVRKALDAFLTEILTRLVAVDIASSEGRIRLLP